MPLPHDHNDQINGVLLIDKPAGWTSHDVVQFIRSRFKIPKVGHAGTLDPIATGLLVVLLGRATKLSARFLNTDKEYEGIMLLGRVTDTHDMTGTVLRQMDAGTVTRAQIESVCAQFVGEIDQVPPFFSAAKHHGTPLYKLARKGILVSKEPKKVTVTRLSIGEVNGPQVSFSLACSKGTYVRSIVQDAGERLGCGATLFALRRTRSGSFSLADACEIDYLKGIQRTELAAHVIGLETLPAADPAKE